MNHEQQGNEDKFYDALRPPPRPSGGYGTGAAELGGEGAAADAPPKNPPAAPVANPLSPPPEQRQEETTMTAMAVAAALGGDAATTTTPPATNGTVTAATNGTAITSSAATSPPPATAPSDKVLDESRTSLAVPAAAPPPPHPSPSPAADERDGANALAAVVRTAVSAVTEEASSTTITAAATTTPVVITEPPPRAGNEPPVAPLVQPEETTKKPPDDAIAMEAKKKKTSTTSVTKKIGTGGGRRRPTPPQPPGPILSASDLRPMDVLSGRGASINTRPGNKKFRALCFVRKRHFDAGNHAAKRQLAVDVVTIMYAGTDHEPPARFLKPRPPFPSPSPPVETTATAVTTVAAASETTAGATTTNTSSDAVTEIAGPSSTEELSAPPFVATSKPETANKNETTKKNPPPNTEVFYYELSNEHAILKAQQVMRDYKRPDRMEAARVRRLQADLLSCEPPQGAADGGGPRQNEDDVVRTTFQLLAEQQQQQQQQTALALEVERAIAYGDGILPSQPQQLERARSNANGNVLVPSEPAPPPGVPDEKAKKPRPKKRRSSLQRRRPRFGVESTPIDGVVETLAAPDVEQDALFRINPYGVHDHDVLSGRGAYVNGHVGNARLRTLATQRKAAFDAGNYGDKRKLATEIVDRIYQLSPPGRFFKKAAPDLLAAYQLQQQQQELEHEQAQVRRQQSQSTAVHGTPAEATVNNTAASATTGTADEDKKQETDVGTTATATATATNAAEGGTVTKSPEPAVVGIVKEVGKVDIPDDKKAVVTRHEEADIPADYRNRIHLIDGIWEELPYDRAIHKACQVMRDIKRPDRKYREHRKAQLLLNKRRKLSGLGPLKYVPTDGGDEGEGVTGACSTDNKFGNDTSTNSVTAMDTTAVEAVKGEMMTSNGGEPTPPLPQQLSQQEKNTETETTGNQDQETAPVVNTMNGAAAKVDSTPAENPLEPTSTGTVVENVVDNALMENNDTNIDSHPSETLITNTADI